MACFVLHNITKARYKPEFKDDVIILEAEMVQIVRPTAEASIASQSAREESRTRYLNGLMFPSIPRRNDDRRILRIYATECLQQYISM